MSTVSNPQTLPFISQSDPQTRPGNALPLLAALLHRLAERQQRSSDHGPKTSRPAMD
jgi:hypothetical protein